MRLKDFKVSVYLGGGLLTSYTMICWRWHDAHKWASEKYGLLAKIKVEPA